MQVRFSGDIEVTGELTLALTVGADTRLAPLARNEGSTLYFRYTVQSGDTDADGVSILASALALNGGSIRDDAGVDAVLDLGTHAIANDSDHKVDGIKVVAPQVRGVRITSRPQDGMAYGAGEEIRGYVRFSQDIEVTGSPTLALTIGTVTRLVPVDFVASRTLYSCYRVQVEDSDTDGISILAGALALNGGTVRSTAGADASLDLGDYAITDHPGHKVDGTKVVAQRSQGPADYQPTSGRHRLWRRRGDRCLSRTQS